MNDLLMEIAIIEDTLKSDLTIKESQAININDDLKGLKALYSERLKFNSDCNRNSTVKSPSEIP